MGESVLHDNPFVGVEGQHLLKEVKGLQHLVHNMLSRDVPNHPLFLSFSHLGVGVGVKLAPGDLWLVRQGLQVTSSLCKELF